MRREKDLRAKQISFGIVAIIVGVSSVFIDGDGTFALVMVPLGIYLIATKQQVIY